MKTKKIILTTMATLIAGVASLASAQNMSAADKAIDYRQNVYGIIGNHFGQMGAVIKGEAEYDQATFAENARAVSVMAELAVRHAFPEVSASGDELSTEALPEIWSDSEGFNERANAFLEATANLAEVSQNAEFEDIRVAFGETGRTCKGCHDDYRD